MSRDPLDYLVGANADELRRRWKQAREEERLRRGEPDPYAEAVLAALRQVSPQQQTHTRPVRLYNEDREEVEVQAVPAEERVCPRCGRLPGCLCHLFEPKGEVVVSFEDREEEVDVDVVTMQDEVEEADKVYDADRPHRTEKAEAALRYTRDMLLLADRQHRTSITTDADGNPTYHMPDHPHAPTQEEQERFWTDSLESVAPTVGELIDRLTIVNVKIYHLEDVVMESEDSETVAAAAKKTRTLNRERSDLKNAITRLVQGSGARMDTKT